MKHYAGEIVYVSDSRADDIYLARVAESFDDTAEGDGTLELYQDEPIIIDDRVIEDGEEIPFNLETMVLSPGG